MKQKIIGYFPWLITGISMVLLILLVIQNWNFRKKNSTLLEYKIKAQYIFNALEFEKNLKKQFIFKEFPFGINPEKFHMYRKPANEQESRYYKNYLIVIFDLTVCGKCLNQSLEILNEFKYKAEENHIFVSVIAGITNKSEESEIVSLYRSGQMPFPFITMKNEEMYKAFKLPTDSYLDTPFFIFTNSSFEIIDIFKPVYLDDKELKRWMQIIMK